MSLDEDLRAFRLAVNVGDANEIVAHASMALRFMDLCAAEKSQSVAEIVAGIDRAVEGLEGLWAVQEALRRYLSRPVGPVELRLNSVFTNFENDTCVAIFDNATAALAYFNSALLPESLRFTDTNGYFRSFRQDSLCYDFNPHGGNEGDEGKGILEVALPWNCYDGSGGFFGTPAPARNPTPLTGDPPPMPEGARPYATQVAT